MEKKILLLCLFCNVKMSFLYVISRTIPATKKLMDEHYCHTNLMVERQGVL